MAADRKAGIAALLAGLTAIPYLVAGPIVHNPRSEALDKGQIVRRIEAYPDGSAREVLEWGDSRLPGRIEVRYSNMDAYRAARGGEMRLLDRDEDLTSHIDRLLASDLDGDGVVTQDELDQVQRNLSRSNRDLLRSRR